MEFSIYKNIILENKIALITGGLGNIGIKICETLLELNCKLIIIDIENDTTISKINYLNKEFKTEIDFYNIDISKKKNIDELCNIIISKYEKIDIFIHCAALVTASNLKGWNCKFEEQSIESLDLCLDINTKSSIIFIQNLINLFKKSEFPKIILISSIYGYLGNDFSLYEDTNMFSPIAYSISKSSINIIVKYLASLYGSNNLCINSIILGGIFRNQNEKFVKKYIEKVPLNRMGNENDIKGLISYLSSNLSNYMTGQNIILDGGLTSKI